MCVRATKGAAFYELESEARFAFRFPRVLIWLEYVSRRRRFNDNKLNTSDNASNYQKQIACVGHRGERWGSAGVAGVVNTINEFQLVVLTPFPTPQDHQNTHYHSSLAIVGF